MQPDNLHPHHAEHDGRQPSDPIAELIHKDVAPKRAPSIRYITTLIGAPEAVRSSRIEPAFRAFIANAHGGPEICSKIDDDTTSLIRKALHVSKAALLAPSSKRLRFEDRLAIAMIPPLHEIGKAHDHFAPGPYDSFQPQVWPNHHHVLDSWCEEYSLERIAIPPEDHQHRWDAAGFFGAMLAITYWGAGVARIMGSERMTSILSTMTVKDVSPVAAYVPPYGPESDDTR